MVRVPNAIWQTLAKGMFFAVERTYMHLCVTNIGFVNVGTGTGMKEPAKVSKSWAMALTPLPRRIARTAVRNHTTVLCNQKLFSFLKVLYICRPEFLQKLGWTKKKSSYCWYKQSMYYHSRIRNQGTSLQECKKKCEDDSTCMSITYAASYGSDLNVCVLCGQSIVRNHRPCVDILC